MVLAVRPLTDVSTWARGNGLEIVLILLGTVLLTRFVSWAGRRVTERIDATASGSDALVRSESSKHRHALTQVATWAVLVAVYCIAALLVLERLGVPVAGLVAPATVAGVALGFGAQRVVQDILAGFFIITERQYGFGDVIRISIVGVGTPAIGTVEDVTLRVTSIRSLDGEVIMTPNGQIAQVTNLSRGWARAVVDVPVPASVEVGRVSRILRTACEKAYEDPELQPLLLDVPSVMGVESIDVDQFHIRVVARTLPGKQFDVGRALRAHIAGALLDEGVSAPSTLDTAGATADE
jgi:small conductance mechanosensitive channel